MANMRVIIDRKPNRRRKRTRAAPKRKRAIADAKADFKKQK